MESEIRIIVAESNLNGEIYHCLSQNPQFKIIATVLRGEDLIKKVPKLKPDVVISDVNLESQSGFEALRIIKEKNSKVKFLFYSNCSKNDFSHTAYNLGAKGLICIDEPESNLYEAVQKIADGGSYFNSKIDLTLNDHFNICNSSKVPVKWTFKKANFSFREEQIMKYISFGYDSIEIAEELSLSKRTVDMYRAAIINRLGLIKNSHLIIYSVLYLLKKSRENMQIGNS